MYPADDDPIVLTEAEARVLGALVEKQLTTPDYYPLTLNALVNACNQTTSRDPVVSYDESVATRALDGLRDKKLAYVYSGADSRALKYGHKLVERLELTPDETAALCVLLLRGPQTGGEIRTRTARLHAFASLTEVDATLAALAATPSRLSGIGHLRGHETDRLAALSTELTRLGGDVEEESDALTIRPRALRGGTWHAYADHRMATAGAVLGLAVDGVVVDDIASTSKTMPQFPALWASLLGA